MKPVEVLLFVFLMGVGRCGKGKGLLNTKTNWQHHGLNSEKSQRIHPISASGGVYLKYVHNLKLDSSFHCLTNDGVVKDSKGLIQGEN